jgi:hypothetical protein
VSFLNTSPTWVLHTVFKIMLVWQLSHSDMKLFKYILYYRTIIWHVLEKILPVTVSTCSFLNICTTWLIILTHPRLIIKELKYILMGSWDITRYFPISNIYITNVLETINKFWTWNKNKSCSFNCRFKVLLQFKQNDKKYQIKICIHHIS